MSSTSLEEAAAVAAEYVSSLDNLPNEVQFLLAEMKCKDEKTSGRATSHMSFSCLKFIFICTRLLPPCLKLQLPSVHAVRCVMGPVIDVALVPVALQQEIDKESAKYIRHALKNNPASKDANIPPKIKEHYSEIDRLAVEKEKLAERIVQLINRARARLEHDLHKVLVLQGELDQTNPAGGYVPYGARNPVTQVIDALKTASNTVAISEAPSPNSAVPPPPKKRRVTAATTVSIKLPSPAPVAPSGGGSVSGQRSRLSQQVARSSPARQQRASRVPATPDADEDAEGDEDVEDTTEDNGDVEDKELYCFCRKLSYGEMIACDNPDCRYQWFHLPCVNLKAPLPGTWYCSECAAKLGVGGPTTMSTPGTTASGGGERQRKGRKK
ncbi:hypothetical protein K474DRAFT_1694352 [Panus rudis PR-1116 ss-1]|nr:hypothetical protein K474DRAFT_1694352 [Panus rudis PR-1116 ss-1]